MALQCLCMEFKFWLRQKMVREGWTQESLAKAVVVTQPTIGQWLLGERPRPDALIRLAKATEEDVWFLFNMVYDLPLPNGNGQGEYNLDRPLMREIIRALPGVDDLGLRLVWDHLRLVVKPRYGRSGEAKNGDENARRE